MVTEATTHPGEHLPMYAVVWSLHFICETNIM